MGLVVVKIFWKIGDKDLFVPKLSVDGFRFWSSNISYEGAKLELGIEFLKKAS